MPRLQQRPMSLRGHRGAGPFSVLQVFVPDTRQHFEGQGTRHRRWGLTLTRSVGGACVAP